MKHELQAILTKYGSMITASASEVDFYGEVASFCERLPDDAQNSVGGIGSISASDFKYAKMQTVHQLLVNTVSRPTETTEKAIELARMVDAAFAEIDAPIQENPVASSGGEYSEKYTDSSGVLAWLKQGKRVARAGWNGEGQFAWLVPEGKYPARMEAIKGFYPDDVVPYAPYFALKNAQGQVVPWIPSVGDLLATDWYVVS